MRQRPGVDNATGAVHQVAIMPAAMTSQSSRRITSDQVAPDQRLPDLLQRHLRRPFDKPVSAHTREAMDWLLPHLDATCPLILDSGCGTAESSRLLAQNAPDSQVLGVDRSAHRLRRAGWSEPGLVSGNLILLRADLVDCWRLLLRHGVTVQQHYLLYPNPYPKPAHLARRWHGHPVFPELIRLGGRIELRTNWSIYAQEFALALELMGIKSIKLKQFQPTQALSAFERKYLHSSHHLFQVVANP